MVVAFIAIPIGSTIGLSLHDWDGFSPVRDFVGLGNFIALIGDGTFWAALVRNLLWILVLLLAVVLGLGFALLFCCGHGPEDGRCSARSISSRR